MQIKEEYKNTNFVEKMYKRLEQLCQKENKELSKLNCLEEYSNAVNKIIEEKWLDTYIALYLLSERIREKNIKINISATNKGILENVAMFMIWLLIDDNEKLKSGIGYSNVIPKKYIENMTLGEIEDKYKDKVFIQVNAKDKETVEQILDELSSNWQENIIIV